MTEQLQQLHFSIHPGIRNKPPQWEPRFASGWEPRTGDLSALRDHILAGTAFIPVALTSPHRSSAAFAHADLAVVDIDHGLRLEDFLSHPLAASCAYVYTTASHSEDHHRYRVIFQLPRRISDPDLYKALTSLLIRSLGGDKSCSDPARLYYAFSECGEPLWQPEAVLPASILEDAEAEATRQRNSYDPATADYDELSIERAIFVLEQVLPPTCDGERDRFTRISAAAAAAGEVIFPAWSDWASRGHHGSGKNSRQASERFFRGFRGSSLATLFYIASEHDPDWRDKLPEELRGGGQQQSYFARTGIAGYDHEDYLGLDDDEEASASPAAAQRTASLFDPERPWTRIATVSPDDDDDEDPADAAVAVQEPDDDGAPPPTTQRPRAGRPGRGGNDEDLVEVIKARLQRLYPGLRLNSMSQELEYGPRDRPHQIHDISTAYVRISRGAGQVFSKTLVHDLAQVIGYENRYHPVKGYLEHCASSTQPCPYFDRIASELLGLPEDDLLSPKLPDGTYLADLILKRFLVGAVARVLEPGCRHDWMPILIGGQNAGKSTFFQYLSPPDPSDPGHYPWVSTIQQGIAYLKEKPHALHSGWISLLDEAERYFKRQHTEELKNLVSVSTDRSARKYENERNFPRSFVLAGTANNSDFLVDPTGNRRFMPIVVTGKVPSPEDRRILIIDLDRLKGDRDAIWSAAYREYLDNPVHLFSSYELSLVADYLDNFGSDSAVDGKLARALETNNSGIWKGQNYVLLSDVFGWLDIPLDRHPSMYLAVTDSMKRCGYRLRRVWMGGKARRIWTRLSPDETD